MSTFTLSSLPLVVRIAVFVTFFNAWVLFEELVIDRHGLWKYMPFYRVGQFCVWDVLALAIIGLCVFLRTTAPRRDANNASGARCQIRWCPIC